MNNKQLAISRPSLFFKSSSVEAFDLFALLISSVDNTSILYQYLSAITAHFYSSFFFRSVPPNSYDVFLFKGG